MISSMIQVDILCIITLSTHTNLIGRTFHTLHHIIPTLVHGKIKAFTVTHTRYSGEFYSSRPDTFSLISQRHAFIYRPSVWSDASYECPLFYRKNIISLSGQIDCNTDCSGCRSGDSIIIVGYYSRFIPLSYIHSLAIFGGSSE